MSNSFYRRFLRATQFVLAVEAVLLPRYAYAQQSGIQILETYSAADIVGSNYTNGIKTRVRGFNDGQLGATKFGSEPRLVHDSINNMDAAVFTLRSQPNTTRTIGTEVWTFDLWPLKPGYELTWESTIRLVDWQKPGVLSTFFLYTDQAVASEKAYPNMTADQRSFYGKENNEIDYEFPHKTIPIVHLMPFQNGTHEEPDVPGSATYVSFGDVIPAGPAWGKWWDYKITWFAKNSQQTRVRWYVKSKAAPESAWKLKRETMQYTPNVTTNLHPNDYVSGGNFPPQTVKTEMRLHFNIWSPAADNEPGEKWPAAYDPSLTATPQEVTFQVASAKVYYRAVGIQGKKVVTR